MATREGIREWCESTRPKDWYGICAGLTYQTIYYNGGYAPDVYPSAWAAYLSTHIESLDAAVAPAGAIHYWDYTDAAGHRYGHVVVDIAGGGTDCLSATHYAHEWWGVSAGLIAVAEQNQHGGMTYMGWSYRYGSRNQITIGEPEPEPEPEQMEDDDMALPVAYITSDDDDPRVWAVYLTAGANNPAAALQGFTYCVRREVPYGEFRLVVELLKLVPLVKMPLTEIDDIPPAFGTH